MPARDPFEYVVIRLVPRVERGESLNVAVALICRPQRFLAAKSAFDRERVMHFAPWLDEATLAELERQVAALERIAAGDTTAGPIAALSPTERWHWLSAPSSTSLQPGPVHTGLTEEPAQELGNLFGQMVTVCE